jgi:thioredoxin-related protein
MTMTRRNFLLAASAASILPPSLAAAPVKEPELSPEGLDTEPWFLESFLDLTDDLNATHKEGKRFVIMWELRGCPYCRETHVVNFAQPRISDYVKANFEVLLLNIIGDRKVKDFDGTEMPEKQLAAKYAIHFTPTFQFFPETAAGLGKLAPIKREVARAPGYLMPDDFLALFHFVREKAYEQGSFLDYLKKQPS